MGFPEIILRASTRSMDIYEEVIQLGSILEEGGDKESHLVTRPTGKSLRRKLEDLFSEHSDASEFRIFRLSFEEVGIVDFSCADEVFAKLCGRMKQGEHQGTYILLDNLRSSHYENISVALQKKQLGLYGRSQDRDQWEEIGKVDQYLQEVLDLLKTKGKLTARMLADKLNLEHNTASTRLGNLHKIRLVARRRESVSKGGRKYVYRRVPDLLQQ